MEPSKKIRIPTELRDIPRIEEKSELAWNVLKSIFNDPKRIESKGWDLASLEDDDWPRSIHFQDENNRTWDILVSSMGSVTLRPSFGKKQPIYYMSIVKFSDGSLEWEDEFQNPKDLESVDKEFYSAIERAKDSL